MRSVFSFQRLSPRQGFFLGRNPGSSRSSEGRLEAGDASGTLLASAARETYFFPKKKQLTARRRTPVWTEAKFANSLFAAALYLKGRPGACGPPGAGAEAPFLPERSAHRKKIIRFRLRGRVGSSVGVVPRAAVRGTPVKNFPERALRRNRHLPNTPKGRSVTWSGGPASFSQGALFPPGERGWPID